MLTRFALRAVLVPWWALLLTGCGGCGDRTYDRYVPSVDTARQALESALKAWQDEKPPGRLDAPGAAIWVVDSHRRPGQKLERYTILGEAPGDTPRCFAVRLHLESPREEQRVRFVLIGVDPLWVFRHEDYQMLAHWECGVEDRDPVKSSAPKN